MCPPPLFALVLFLSSTRIIRASVISASNHHLTEVNADSCSAAPGCCQSKASPLAQTGFLGNSWPISVCLDEGFSSLRWLFWSDKYNVVLGAGVEERGADEITSQGSWAAKQQAARQDKNCHERRRKIKAAWEIIDIPSWIQVGPRRGFEREPVPLFLRNMGREIWKISEEIVVIIRHVSLCSWKEGNVFNSCWVYFKAFTTVRPDTSVFCYMIRFVYVWL